MWLDRLNLLDAPEERLYWPYLVGSLVMAVAGAAFGRVSLANELFARALWWHPSARADYGLVVVRALLSALVISPLFVTSTVIAVKVVLAMYAMIGAPPVWPFDPLSTTLGYTLLLFIASDATRYALHRWMHQSPFLWRFHQVHHSAEVMTPVTLYRIHPVEGALAALRAVLVTGAVAGVFSWLTRGQAVSTEVLGVNAVFFVLNLAGSNLRHSHVWISFGPIEYVLLSPAQHQLHHSIEHGGHGINYGSFLAIWDRLGNSFVRATVRPRAFGLEQSQCNHHPSNLWSMLIGPFLGRPSGSLPSHSSKQFFE